MRVRSSAAVLVFEVRSWRGFASFELETSEIFTVISLV